MQNTKSAFQQDEHSASWKHKAQGPLTLLLFVNYTSETKPSCSNCAVTIHCASQKVKALLGDGVSASSPASP